MKPASSAGWKTVPCTATASDPHSSATSQLSIGRSPSPIGLILIPGSSTPSLSPPLSCGWPRLRLAVVRKDWSRVRAVRSARRRPGAAPSRGKRTFSRAVIKSLRRGMYFVTAAALWPVDDVRLDVAGLFGGPAGMRRRGPSMKWFFEPPYGGDGSGTAPPHGGDGSGTGPGLDDGAAPGLIGLPEAVRLRHGVRVLDPQPAAVAAINRVLESTGMRLVAPEEDAEEDAGEERGEGALFEVLRDLPRPAVLAPTGTAPVVVDAWRALQTLRAAGTLQRAGADVGLPGSRAGADEGLPGSRAGADEAVPGSRAGLDEAVVWRISREHLLVGSAITGSPIDNGPGGIAGGPGGSSGGVGPTTTDSYLFSGGDPRTPVAVVLAPPRRRSAGECRADYGRRPVVAVLDTG